MSTTTSPVDTTTGSTDATGALHPQRLAVRFPLRTRIEDLEPAITVFHRCIQRGWLEGRLIDVADYRHVPAGPGVMLVGHDVEYALSHESLSLTRKRSSDDDAATQLTDLVRMAAVAVEAFAYDGTLQVDADLGRATVTLLDRALVHAIDGEPGEVLADAVAPALEAAWGTRPRVRTTRTDDARRAPTAVADAAQDAAAADVLERLGGSQAPMQSPFDITVEEFSEQRGSDGVLVLDVREASEYETVNLGGTLVPLAELPDRLDELDREARVLVHCRAGIRGGKAVRILREAGFGDAWNVNGALVAWADRIDPETLRY